MLRTTKASGKSRLQLTRYSDLIRVFYWRRYKLLNCYPYILFRNIIRFQRFCYIIKINENRCTHICTYKRIPHGPFNESMDVCTHSHKHAFMNVCMHVSMHAHTVCCLLAVGCYCGIMRTRPKLLETALRQYIARKTGVDLIRVGEIEVRASDFVQVLYF